MSEKEQKILKNLLGGIIPQMTEKEQERMLGFAEGMAFMIGREKDEGRKAAAGSENAG